MEIINIDRVLNNFDLIQGAIEDIKAFNASNTIPEYELKQNKGLDKRNVILNSLDFTKATREQQIELLSECDLTFNQRAGLMWQYEDMGDRMEVAAAASKACFEKIADMQHQIIAEQDREYREKRNAAEKTLQDNEDHTSKISAGMENNLVSLSLTAQRHFEDVMWLNDNDPAKRKELLEKTKLMGEQLAALATVVLNDGKITTKELREIRGRQNDIRDSFFPAL